MSTVRSLSMENSENLNENMTYATYGMQSMHTPRRKTSPSPRTHTPPKSRPYHPTMFWDTKLAQMSPHGASNSLTRISFLREIGMNNSRRTAMRFGPTELGKEAIWHFSQESPILSVRNSIVQPCITACCDENGFISFIHTDRGKGNIFDIEPQSNGPVIAHWQAHSNAIFDIAWNCANQLVTASADQTICLWDTSRRQCLSVFRGHTGTVRGVTFKNDGPHEFASSGRDGNVMIWDTRAGTVRQMSGEPHHRPVSQLRGCHVLKHASNSSVAGSVFLPHNLVLATAGCADGAIKFWDIRRPVSAGQEPRPFTSIFHRNTIRPHGYTSIDLDESGTRLVGSCRDGQVYMYDCLRPEHAPRRYAGHNVGSFFIKVAINKPGTMIACGSSDDRAYVWHVDDIVSRDDGAVDPRAILEGHGAEVSGVAWDCSTLDRLVTCADEGTVRCWTLGRPDPIINVEPIVEEEEEEEPEPPHTPSITSSANLIKPPRVSPRVPAAPFPGSPNGLLNALQERKAIDGPYFDVRAATKAFFDAQKTPECSDTWSTSSSSSLPRPPPRIRTRRKRDREEEKTPVVTPAESLPPPLAPRRPTARSPGRRRVHAPTPSPI